MMNYTKNVTIRPVKIIGMAAVIATPVLATSMGLSGGRASVLLVYVASVLGYIGGVALSSDAFHRWFRRSKMAEEIQAELEQKPDSNYCCDVEIDNVPQENGGIDSDTHNRLMRSIEAFPERYPEYKTKPPKLDDDVRLWLEESGLGKNDAERRVFGVIIREHFKLSPDTKKS